MLHDIIEANPLDDYRLFQRFDDGASGIIDIATMRHFDGVFAPLQDANYFEPVRVGSEVGTVVWPNRADLGPDVMHAGLTGLELCGTGEAAGTHVAAG
jgi:hypothetical protein